MTKIKQTIKIKFNKDQSDWNLATIFKKIIPFQDIPLEFIFIYMQSLCKIYILILNKCNR